MTQEQEICGLQPSCEESTIITTTKEKRTKLKTPVTKPCANCDEPITCFYSGKEYCANCKLLCQNAQKKIWCIQYKGGKCSICNGEANLPGDREIWQFHHRNREEKNDNISRMIRKHASYEKLRNELDLCDLIHVSCHRKEEHKYSFNDITWEYVNKESDKLVYGKNM